VVKPALLHFRPYQLAAFQNQTDGIQVWLWGRQTGKSFTLAAWAVHRLISRPGRTVTILSNSRENGIELNRRCAEVCELLQRAFDQIDLAPDNRFESFNTETRICIDGQCGRIRVRAANPRTARGFFGDLILDEFAFHENSAAIWEAAEPTLASHPDFLCRIASTPNGKHNAFYQLATDPSIPCLKITRTDAHAQGCPVYHPVTRAPIAPAQARALAPNKRAYDQNYECVFEDESMALLTHTLITTAERPNLAAICHQDWTPDSLAFLSSTTVPRPAFSQLDNLGPDNLQLLVTTNPHSAIRNPQFPPDNLQPDNLKPLLFAGIDVGRHHDLTVITVLEKANSTFLVRAILRLQSMSLPEQQKRLETLLLLPNLRSAKIDMTGLGLGLFEYTCQKFPHKITGLNFAATAPIHSIPHPLPPIRNPHSEIRNPTVRLTELLATRLLQAFEDRSIQIPIDQTLRDDLRKPERHVSPSGRVSIAASRDRSGHADHFWSLALALDAAQSLNNAPPTQLTPLQREFRPSFNSRQNGISL
jgi:phage FluMu gp28-like protein